MSRRRKADPYHFRGRPCLAAIGVIFLIAWTIWTFADAWQAGAAPAPTRAYAPLVVNGRQASTPLAVLTDCGAAAHAGWDCGTISATRIGNGDIILTIQARPAGTAGYYKFDETSGAATPWGTEPPQPAGVAPSLVVDAGKVGLTASVSASDPLCMYSYLEAREGTSGPYSIYWQRVCQ